MKVIPMIDWHFSRKDLANAYLSQFATGITSALTLFAPRRYGKTEFLLRDLVPAAEAAGYRVVYASMWASRTDPLKALLAALDEGLKPVGIGEKVKALFNSPVKSLELEAEMGPLGKAKASADLAGDTKAAADDLLSFATKLDALVDMSQSGVVLLLLDEVQFLAKPQYEDMVAALRTALDRRKDEVKVVYTGSSRVRLQRMFDAIKAPLFRSSQTTNFPVLGKPFVDFMLNNLKEATGRTLNADLALQGFEAISHSPGLFREAIEAAIMDNNDDIIGLCKLIANKAEHGAGYEETWASYKDIDRAVILRVIDNQSLYTTDACVSIACEIGLTKLTAQQIQACIKRLADAQVLLSKGRGRYEVEDPGFAQWINNKNTV